MTWTPDITKFERLKDQQLETKELKQSHGIATVTVHTFRPTRSAE
jgi:hypothetical protein